MLKINIKRDKSLIYLLFGLIIFFINCRAVKSRTFVPGKSSYYPLQRVSKIYEIIKNNSYLKKTITKELLNYSLCNSLKILEEEKNLKDEYSKICTNLYLSLATEKIWFDDEMLWEFANYRKIDIVDPNTKEICYDASLLGTGDGIKCYTPRRILRDPKNNLPLFYNTTCSDKYLNENPKIKNDLFKSLSSYESQNSLKNDWEIDCNSSAKEGSQRYREYTCNYPLQRGDEDEILGSIVGKDCRDRFPELIFSSKNREKIQKRIASDLIKFIGEENIAKTLIETGYKDLMSDKYSIRQKKYFCMEEALNEFKSSPSFYKNYCDKLMN